jgi:hypothetical protein
LRLHKLVWLPAMGAMACWGGEPWTPPEGATPWRPLPTAPPGWVIATVDSPHACPDGQLAEATVLRPAEPGDDELGVAVVIPDASFDYVISPDLAAPLTGTTFQQPSRLGHDWGLRQAWAVAGLYRSGDPAVTHAGAVSIALADHHVAVVIPTLCWGDYAQGTGGSPSIDGFERLGGRMAEWTWQAATTDPGSLGLDGADPSKALLVGLGEGGRGAAEILRGATVPPTALLVDSADDDLGVYWDDPGAWADRIAGLDRIYPQGAANADARSLTNAPLPARTALAWSSADPRMPAGAIDALVARVTQLGGRVDNTEAARHVQAAGDPELAGELVGWLLDEAADTDP